MIRYIFLLASIVILNASQLNSPLKVTIRSIDSNKITLLAMNLKVGESGVINHKFGNNYEGIIGLLEITEIKSGIAYAKLINRNLLTQKYLPNPTTKIAKNDEVYFRLFNNKAFIIAPNLETYQRVILQNNKRDNVEFLNSDLMMGYLMTSSGFDPKPKFFNQVCEVYNVGLLYVITQNRLNIMDCQSLVVLESRNFNTSNITSTSAPFFSRAMHESSGSLDSSIKKKYSTNYFEYYGRFIKEGKNFSPKSKDKK